MEHRRRFFALYLRNFIFGVEDSLVSTVGLLTGVAVAGVPRATILLTGIILIFVEAFSMAAGSFLSEDSVEEYIKRKNVSARGPFAAGAVMFLSYFFSGFAILFPYMIFPVNRALWVSIVLSLAFLYILGIFGAKVAGVPLNRRGLRALFIGGTAIGIGILVAQISFLF